MKKTFILFLLLQSVINILAQNATYVDKSIKFEMTNDYQELITETLLDNNTRELKCLRFIIIDSVMGEKSISFGKGSEIHLIEDGGKTYIILQNSNGGTFFMNMDMYNEDSEIFVVGLGKSDNEMQNYILKSKPKDERIVNLFAQLVRFEKAELFTTKKKVN